MLLLPNYVLRLIQLGFELNFGSGGCRLKTYLVIQAGKVHDGKTRWKKACFAIVNKNHQH